MSHYSQERIENISRIMPTYGAFIKSGDEVELGLKGDPLYPTAYRNSRPRGTVKSVFGPKGAQVVNVQLNDEFGGKMAHCDVRTLNPYLLFEPVEASYQRAIERAEENPDMQAELRSEFEQNDITFRGIKKNRKAEPAYGRIDKLNERMEQLEAEHERTRDTMMRAIKGLASDISVSTSEKEATYAGRMLQMIEDEEPDNDDIEFRGLDDDDDEEEIDNEASDEDDDDIFE